MTRDSGTPHLIIRGFAKGVAELIGTQTGL